MFEIIGAIMGVYGLYWATSSPMRAKRKKKKKLMLEVLWGKTKLK